MTIDGVPVTGATSPMRLSSGRLAGLATLRDESAVTYGNQLDAIAGALIDTFKETGSAGAKTGLFTAGASGALPGSNAGLAGRIALNAAVDPTIGGDVTTLRDGGMNGLAYKANPGTDAAYATRLRGLVDGLATARSFTPARR